MEKNLKDRTIEEMKRDYILKGIISKQNVFKGDINAFLNSLNEDEFNYYIR